MIPRDLIRMAINRMDQTREWLNKVPVPPGESSEADIALSRAKVHIDNAKKAALEAIDPLLVKWGDKEPLNEVEERIYDNPNGTLRIGPSDVAKLTHEQKFSAARVIARHDCKVVSAALTDHLGIQFAEIYIGIEPDGYAHS